MNLQELKIYLSKDPKFKKAFELLDDDLAFQIGQQITSVRIGKGFSQEELAKKVKTHQPSIARIEGGEYLPSLTFLVRITNALEAKLSVRIEARGISENIVTDSFDIMKEARKIVFDSVDSSESADDITAQSILAISIVNS